MNRRGTAHHDGAGPQLDLTFGRIGHSRSGFLHIGGTPGDLHLSASLYHHPQFYGYGHDHGDYDDYIGVGGYPYDYPSTHYYYDYHPLGYHDYLFGLPYYGYSYSSVYYDEPVVYRLQSPTVVYAQQEPVYVEDNPDATVVYEESPATAYEESPATSAPATVRPPQVSGPPAEAPEAPPYQAIDIGGASKSVVQEGTAAFAAGHFEKAKRLFIEAVLADERDGYAKLLYGYAAFASGDYRLAGITIRRALRTSDGLLYRPLDVRTLYSDQSLFESHAHALQVRVENHPKDKEAKFVLAYVYYATAKPKIAAERFGELAASDKDDDLAMRLYETARAVERVVPE